MYLNERLCHACEHFSPAFTCMEKPTWGYCERQAVGPPGGHPTQTRSSFTWADSRCDNFQPRGQVVRR
jgi:hypothetical protein